MDDTIAMNAKFDSTSTLGVFMATQINFWKFQKKFAFLLPCLRVLKKELPF